MITKQTLIDIFKVFFVVVTLSSCGSQKRQYYNPYEVEELSRKLSIPINSKDNEDDRNIPLYSECSLWLGVPYRYSGQTKNGTDCSGFVMNIFEKVYQTKLPRSTSDQSKKGKKVNKKKMQAGDLVFFATTKKKKKATHVGIYLKNNKFVHASTSRGVIVSDLNEQYYKKNFINAKRTR